MTNPIEEILPLSNENVELNKMLLKFSNGISEAVNYSTHIFKWCYEKPLGNDEVLPIFMSLRHIIELADSISILVKHSSIDPCKFFLRGILESAFNILYILDSNTKNRAMYFLVWYHNQKLKLYDKFDPSTDVYKQLLAEVEKDKIVGKIGLPKFDNIQEMKDNLTNLLAKPLSKDINEEYQLNKKQIKNWYSFYDGPRSLEQLANVLNYQGLYNILYRTWSGAIHGTDILQNKVSLADNGYALITQIRFVKDAQITTSITLSLLFEVLRKVISHFIPNKMTDFDKWYISTIRDFYVKVTDEKLIDIK